MRMVEVLVELRDPVLVALDDHIVLGGRLELLRDLPAGSPCSTDDDVIGHPLDLPRRSALAQRVL